VYKRQRLRASVENTNWTHTLGMDLTVDSVDKHTHEVPSVNVSEGIANVFDYLRNPNISGSTLQKLIDLLEEYKANRN